MTANAANETLTLPHRIGHRAALHGSRRAVTFVADDGGVQGWTYRELWQRACNVAAALPPTSELVPRAVLVFPPGLDFLAGFLGCQIAGWIPVPTCYPKPKRVMLRLDSAAEDCQPSAMLSDQATLDALDVEKLSAATRSIPHLAVDSVDQANTIDPEELRIDPESLALLQYTSGSTSEPKGVMVRHRNLVANLEAIRVGFDIQWQADDAPDNEIDTGVFWLPFFHDMGLIGGLLEPLYVGGHSVVMSPRSFLQRPLRWLQTISNFGASISGAPNFAYQLCVDRITPDQVNDLDLSRWRVAFSGAEPILPTTLNAFAKRFEDNGFSSSAFYPCYGLAEATLLAAGGHGPSEPKLLTVQRDPLGRGIAEIATGSQTQNNAQQLVCCGPPAHNTDVLVVDTQSKTPQAENRVGEIWLRGSSVTAGYWQREQENADRFDATLSDGESGFCRTGDLGFIHDGELYITGRSKDVIILRGRNHFPQDIETTARDVVGSEGGMCAAIAVSGPRSEGLALIVEVPRRMDVAELPDLARQIRRSVIDIHEVDPRHVCLVRPATVPLTSSGKVQRNRCREMFDQDEIKSKFRYDRAFSSEHSPIPFPVLPEQPTADDRESMVTTIEGWMTNWLIARAGVEADTIDLEKPFADYGLDSMTAVELSGELEDWSGVELTPVVAWNHPTVSRMSVYITDSLMDKSDVDADEPDAELDALLDELAQMSDDEVDHALADDES